MITATATIPKQKTKYELENLVVLRYSSNICYTRVNRADKVSTRNFELDLVNGTWTVMDFNSKPYTNSIGKRRYIEHGCRGGIIGVYDRTNIQHLNSMVSDSQEATAPSSSWVED